MKYVKIILKVFGVIFGVILVLFILNYVRLNVSYLVNKGKYVEVFDVQGNSGNYVPQGLAYSEKYNVALQTSYNSNHTVSMIYVTDFETGKLLKKLKLMEVDESDNVNHVGGIATDDEIVWITNDYEVNEYSLEEIINTEENHIQSLKNTKLPNRGDFCTYNDNILWIGDFCLSPFYKVPDNNPLLMGYDLEEILDYSKPDYVVSLPKMVQGMTITPDNKFILTRSFTNLIKSDLSIYDKVLESENDYYELNGRKVPYYKFDRTNLVKKIKLPPMAEGLFYKDKALYILFENSSDTYYYAYPKMDKVIRFEI